MFPGLVKRPLSNLALTLLKCQNFFTELFFIIFVAMLITVLLVNLNLHVNKIGEITAFGSTFRI